MDEETDKVKMKESVIKETEEISSKILEVDSDEDIEKEEDSDDSWGIDSQTLRSTSRNEVVTRMPKPDEIEIPLEKLVEDEDGDLESQVGISQLSDNLGVEYASSGGSVLPDISRSGGGMRNKDEQLYAPGGEEAEGFYETRNVDISGNAAGGMYDSRIKIDPNERSWSTDTHWRPGIESAGLRGLDGKPLQSSRDMIEGQSFMSDGIQDGFATMNSKPKYEPNGS